MTRLLTRSLPAIAVVLASTLATAQTNNIAVNNDGRAPDASAILDVSSNFALGGMQKGMLIPRMTMAQRAALGAPGTLATGLTVFITDPGQEGFYYIEYTQWMKIDGGANSWDILGNDLGVPANDFFGTRDDMPIRWLTNNTERMRMLGTPGARYVGIGQTVPAEQIDVNGALRIYNPSPGSWPAPLRYAATNTQGTILFRPQGIAPLFGDSLFATYTPPAGPPYQNKNTIMWAGHWGNIDGTPIYDPAATDDANTGGWRRLENDYTERFQKAYQQQGTPVCGAGTFAEVSSGSTSYTDGIAAPGGLNITPYKHDLTARRYRVQYLFLRNELNVEMAQLGGNTTTTGGLCPGQPVNSISFWINMPVAAGNQRNWQYVLTVKHVSLGINNLNGGFDNGNDPASGCAWSNAVAIPAINAAAGWHQFNLTTPFIWDGIRNVVVDVAVNMAPSGATNTVQGLPVRYSNTVANLTYFAYAGGPPYAGACAPLSGIGIASCNPTNVTTNLGSSCGTFGPSPNRAVIRWGGTVANAPPLTTGTNSYIYYVGGLVSESTSSPAPFGRQVTPYYAFKGPGTITAQNGVYDNGLLLNDHVFDRAFDGAVKPQDAEAFGRGRNYGIEEMSAFTRTNRHLPTVKGRDSWRVEGGFSLGDITNQLWTTAETQALYLTELHDQLNVIELLSTDRPIDPKELELARASVCAMEQYTEREKAALLRSLEERTTGTDQR